MKLQGIERLEGLRPVKKTDNVVLALSRAANLLKDRRRWCKGFSNLYGDGTRPLAHCAVGAVERYADTYSEEKARKYLNMSCKPGNIITFNDNPKTGHSRILDVFRRAIKLAKENEK